MSEVLEFVLPWVVTTYALFVLLAWDEARLSEEELARAWPPASRSIAGVYFGVLSIPVHFWRTRRSFLGFLQGLGWMVALVALDEGVALGVEELVKRLGPT